jgi:hypothetical protein
MVDVAASVPMISSASYSGLPTIGMPRAVSASTMTGTCGVSVSGTTSVSGPTGAASATRCALYVGSRSTRHCGRQSSSQQAISSVGEKSVTSRPIMSSSPRIALTGIPSGDFTVSGMP